MRKLVRTLGTLMIVAGVGSLAWAFAVWRWEDPFTSLYTAKEQRALVDSFDSQVESYRGRLHAGATLAAVRTELRGEARRYHRRARRGEAIGRIDVPRLGLRMVVVYGTDHESLKRGPGLDPRTFMPGQNRLVYIAGHRTTYAAPFSRIEQMRRGDRITVEMPYGTFEYETTRNVIVPATQISVLRSKNREEVALQACHPRFFASHRWITYGRLVKVSPRGGSTYSTVAAASSG